LSQYTQQYESLLTPYRNISAVDEIVTFFESVLAHEWHKPDIDLEI
jgi:hypothetical protein